MSAGGEAFHGLPLQLNQALYRLIVAETIEQVRASVCEGALALAHVDTTVLFERQSTAGAAMQTWLSGDPGAGEDAFALVGTLAELADREGCATSTLDRHGNRQLDRHARHCTSVGQLAVAYPLLNNAEPVGALVVVSGWRPRLEDPERWALRRFTPAAAAAILAARRHLDLARLAHTDPLTGLANRRGLEQALQGAPAGSGLLLVDFDDLKTLNEDVGYDVGDEVVAAIGACLEGEQRPGELAARLGGDEFIMLLDAVTDQELAAREKALSACLDALEVPERAVGHYRGASVASLRLRAGENGPALMRRASAQMRQRKRRRKTDRDE
jgi:diguanylate cyclase (GGDEF)-like protein